MKPLEEQICYLSELVYKYYHEIAKEEMDGEGEDTFELAYYYAHDVLSGAAITLGEIFGDKLILHALDCACILRMNADTGKPDLWEYLRKGIMDKFGFCLALGLINEHCKLNDYKETSFIYSFTKPYLESQYDLIKEGELTWEEAFNIKTEDKND